MRKLLILAFLIVVIDQATKTAITQTMGIGQSRPIIGDLLRFTFVENPGMAFGLDFGMPLLLGLFSIGAAFFLIYLIKSSPREKIGGFHYALAMILGGAVGNLIDRVFYGVIYDYASLFHGKVVDFIDIDIPDIVIGGFDLDRFYVFNIADAAVSIGIVLLLLTYGKHQKEVERLKALETPPPPLVGRGGETPYMQIDAATPSAANETTVSSRPAEADIDTGADSSSDGGGDSGGGGGD